MSSFKIEELFVRDIHREINGVVKADQLKPETVWQELDEFVVTRELRNHFEDLIKVLKPSTTVSSRNENGIWVSGFFGCGKSHFIKVLSYLLENKEHSYAGETRRAVRFFEDKLADDPLLFADLQQVVGVPTETLLFNIDPKADRSKPDVLPRVFLGVLNEKQGYSADHPHIARMERHLDERGNFAAFKQVFEREALDQWVNVRDGWDLFTDQIVVALMEADGMSQRAAENWTEVGEQSYALTINKFAAETKRYLDRCSPDQRLIFLVDEVGQFIGSDTQMMLNLQTITEQLGTVCNGRAWVVVTSQEDIEATIGDMRDSRPEDYSKIQGRFKTKIALSSTNVDEVIQKRLLDKKESVTPLLASHYQGKHDILRNQLSFLNARSFATFEDVNHFAECYPFPAYQFKLVQRVFESIRVMGAAGKHLSEGERSVLDAFQIAAQSVGSAPIGKLVPFHTYYETIEVYLESAVSRTIDQTDNSALNDADRQLLKLLFLIRYIEELPGSVDNLVTLCIDEIDANRQAIRRSIENSLHVLERETLVGRKGDLYYFLTNEERDVSREIKNQSIQPGDEARALGKMIFDEIYESKGRHGYRINRQPFRHFNYSKLSDGRPVGNIRDAELQVECVTPLNADYESFIETKCELSTSGTKKLLIHLPDAPALSRELKEFIQTDTYIKKKPKEGLHPGTQKIILELTQQNRARRQRLLSIVEDQLKRAQYYSCGQHITLSSSVSPRSALTEGLNYLIQNVYSKMSYIQFIQSNPRQEIRAVLSANSLDEATLELNDQHSNQSALEAIENHIRTARAGHVEVNLDRLVDQIFGRIPYGWPELETLLLVAKLVKRNKIQLLVDEAIVPITQVESHFYSSASRRRAIVDLREVADPSLISAAIRLGIELFARTGPNSEEDLVRFLKQGLERWQEFYDSVKPLAVSGYPGLSIIEEAFALTTPLIRENTTIRFLNSFVDHSRDLQDLLEDHQDLEEFYTNQRPTWDRLTQRMSEFQSNQNQLQRDPEAGPAFQRLHVISQMPAPYGVLHEVAGLIEQISTVNQRLASVARQPVLAYIANLLTNLEHEITAVGASSATGFDGPLRRIQQSCASQMSIAHIINCQRQADAAFDEALHRIAAANRPSPQSPGQPAPPPVKEIQSIQLQDLMPGLFIEEQSQADAFVQSLSERLNAALKQNKRIRIR